MKNFTITISIAIVFVLFHPDSLNAATVTRSICASGCDYTTPASWEADLDNGAVYGSGDDAVGELYDEVYLVTSGVTINGGGTVGLNSITLSVAPGERSDGIAGTGARIYADATIAGSFLTLNPLSGSDKLIVEYVEISGNGNTTTLFISTAGATSGRVPIVRYVMLHDGQNTTANNSFIGNNTRDVLVHNSIMYDYVMTANNRTIYGINCDCDQAGGGIFNNIVYGLTAHGSGVAIGIRVFSDDPDGIVRNNISVGHTNNPVGFEFAGSSNLTSSNNLSEDATADDGGGSGHITGATLADLFVSTVSGSEDFSPKTGSAPQVNTGVDLGTTPTGVNFDFKGRDRDAQGDVWDIGAIEYVSAPPSGGGTRVIRLHGVRLYGIRLR